MGMAEKEEVRIGQNLAEAVTSVLRGVFGPLKR